MAKLKLYPKDCLFRITAKNSVTGEVIDLTQYENYQLFVWSNNDLIQKFSKVTTAGFTDLIPVDETTGVFDVPLYRTNLKTAQIGNVFCQLKAIADNTTFEEDEYHDIGDPAFMFELVKNNNLWQ